MTTTVNGNDLLFVEVPTDFGHDFTVREGRLWFSKTMSGYQTCYRNLPDGRWKFLFTTKNCTEEEAAKIAEEIEFAEINHGWYVSYVHEDFCYTALESLQSLIISIGLDTEKNYAVLKKIQ